MVHSKRSHSDLGKAQAKQSHDEGLVGDNSGLDTTRAYKMRNSTTTTRVRVVTKAQMERSSGLWTAFASMLALCIGAAGPMPHAWWSAQMEERCDEDERRKLYTADKRLKDVPSYEPANEFMLPEGQLRDMITTQSTRLCREDPGMRRWQAASIPGRKYAVGENQDAPTVSAGHALEFALKDAPKNEDDLPTVHISYMDPTCVRDDECGVCLLGAGGAIAALRLPRVAVGDFTPLKYTDYTGLASAYRSIEGRHIDAMRRGEEVIALMVYFVPIGKTRDQNSKQYITYSDKGLKEDQKVLPTLGPGRMRVQPALCALNLRVCRLQLKYRQARLNLRAFGQKVLNKVNEFMYAEFGLFSKILSLHGARPCLPNLAATFLMWQCPRQAWRRTSGAAPARRRRLETCSGPSRIPTTTPSTASSCASTCTR